MKKTLVVVVLVSILSLEEKVFAQHPSEDRFPAFFFVGLGGGWMTVMNDYFPQFGAWQASLGFGFGPLRLQYSGLVTGGNQMRMGDSVYYVGRTYGEERFAVFYRLNYGILWFGPGIGWGKISIVDQEKFGDIRRTSSVTPYGFEVATEWRYGSIGLQYWYVTSHFKPEQMYLIDFRFHLPLDRDDQER